MFIASQDELGQNAGSLRFYIELAQYIDMYRSWENDTSNRHDNVLKWIERWPLGFLAPLQRTFPSGLPTEGAGADPL